MQEEIILAVNSANHGYSVTHGKSCFVAEYATKSGPPQFYTLADHLEVISYGSVHAKMRVKLWGNVRKVFLDSGYWKREQVTTELVEERFSIGKEI